MKLSLNTIHQGDSLERLCNTDPGTVALAFADPPFNIGYSYDIYNDRRSPSEYLAWSMAWMERVFEVLKPNGTLWLAIGDEFAAELKVTAQNVGFVNRSWVIWYYTFGVHCKRGFSRSHTHLFHFVKDPKDFAFNQKNPAVRVPSARQLVYADTRANPRGRLPDNTWMIRPQDVPCGFSASCDTWYFPRVAGTFKERQGFHGCQMPEQLLGRVIRISSHPNDLVLDPFAGSGTTLSVAKKLGRQWMGIELSSDYVRHARKRLKGTSVGDPLDGAEDPLSSAPATKNGKVRFGLQRGLNLRQRRKKQRDGLEQEIGQAVVRAFSAAHQGYSADQLLARPELNQKFVELCGEAKIPGDAVIWNQTLLRLRKRGALPKGMKPICRITFAEMDPYSLGSEVALQQLTVNYQLSLDGILCDPELATIFDQVAGNFAVGYTPFEYRWAALALRKRAKLAKQTASHHHDWGKRSLPRAVLLERCSSEYDGAPGVYLLLDPDRVGLYLGETCNLGERMRQIGETDAWRELGVTAVRCVRQPQQSLHGVKAVLLKRINPRLNWRLLFP